MNTLTDRVPTLKGDIMVTTKTRFLFFLNRPHTSIMPFGLTEFGRKLGFQVHYNTADPNVLAECHEFYVSCIAAGGFDALMAGAKMGFVDFIDGKNHLAKYVIGFRA